MKRKFTGEQFIELVDKGKWKRSQIICPPGTKLVRRFNKNVGAFCDVWEYSGDGFKVSELDGIEIHYCETYSYIKYMPRSFKLSSLVDDLPWVLENALIVDDYGDWIGGFEQTDFLRAVCNRDFRKIDYSSIHRELEEAMDIDEIDDSDNDFICVEVDYAPNLRFNGVCIARVQTNDNKADPDFSGKTGKWDDWSIYKTRSGKLVCSATEYNKWAREPTTYRGKVCENEKEVIEFFGHCELAKELYEKGGIDDVIDA